MRKTRSEKNGSGVPAEYDFRGGIRGKYARRYAAGTNVVVLSPENAKLFPDSESVNVALRACAELIRLNKRNPKTRRSA